MKTIGIVVLLGLLALNTPAQSQGTAPKLTGIVSWPGTKRAVFQLPSKSLGSTASSVLAEAERDGDIEVVQIRPDDRAVKVRLRTLDGELTLKLDSRTNQPAPSFASLDLEDISLNTILSFYGEWSARTLLRWPSLPDATFSITGSPTNRTEAAKVLEKALAQKQIVVITDGSKFAMVVPADKAEGVKPRSSQIKRLDKSDDQHDLLEIGTIRFYGADLSQFLTIYADLLGSEFDKSSAAPPVHPLPVWIRQETAFSKAECLYAFETLLAWQNMKLVPAAPGFVKAVPLSKTK
jgi:hypothetical protein